MFWLLFAILMQIKTKTPKSKRNTTFHRLYKSKMFFEAFLCAIFIGCPTVQYCGSPSVDIEGVHVSMFADLLLNAFTSRVEHWMVFSTVKFSSRFAHFEKVSWTKVLALKISLKEFWKGSYSTSHLCANFSLDTHTLCANFGPNVLQMTQDWLFLHLC